MGTIGYRELAATLRDAIRQGRYAPGDTLPKQDELATEYGVNDDTGTATLPSGLGAANRARWRSIRARCAASR